jgi:formate dehydrogenase iron-sulfur subunit
MSCPFGIPRYSWSSAVPYVQKCVLCYDNIKSGKISEPACTSACPAQATIFGERKELLSEAHRRIKKRPDLYIDKVFGEEEVGGTSILYISSINLDFLGLNKNLGETALPEKTWGALKIVPGLFSGVGLVMGGIWWIIERRMKLQKANHNLNDESTENEHEK